MHKQPICISTPQGNRANQIVPAALLLCCVYGALLHAFAHPGLFGLLALVFLLCIALNAPDHRLAQEYHQQSKMGALLNKTSHALADLPPAITGKRSYADPCGKSDRILIFAGCGLFLALYPQISQRNNLLPGIMRIALLWMTINCCRSALITEAD